MPTQQWHVDKPYLAVPCSLGEGVYYVKERHELRFLDINKSKLYIIDLHKGPESVREIDTGEKVGVTVDIEGVDSSKVILAGSKLGVSKFSIETGNHEYIAKYWPDSQAEDKGRRMRGNDGAVDSSGRFWVEAFVDPDIADTTDEGTVFRLDPDGSLTTMYEKIEIPNGITWNAKDDRMHLTDTTVGKIWSFAYDRETGNISDKKLFYQHEGEGNPDGHTIDEHQNIWQALYGGSKVLRISPEGKITGEILLPTRNITCCVFAGEDLFITSAEEDEPDKYPESAKYAGNLFKAHVGVGGAPKHKARLASS